MDATTKIDMATTCYYTFSTVCQTLAGAFGFLVAAAVYRMGLLETHLASAWDHQLRDRAWIETDALQDAVYRFDWVAISDALNKTAPQSQVEKNEADKLIHNRARFAVSADHLRFIRQDLRYSLKWTGWTIGLSLLVMPFTPLIAQSRIAWIFMGGSVLAAICCLSTYYELAKRAAQ